MFIINIIYYILYKCIIKVYPFKCCRYMSDSQSVWTLLPRRPGDFSAWTSFRYWGDNSTESVFYIKNNSSLLT